MKLLTILFVLVAFCGNAQPPTTFRSYGPITRPVLDSGFVIKIGRCVDTPRRIGNFYYGGLEYSITVSQEGLIAIGYNKPCCFNQISGNKNIVFEYNVGMNWDSCPEQTGFGSIPIGHFKPDTIKIKYR